MRFLLYILCCMIVFSVSCNSSKQDARGDTSIDPGGLPEYIPKISTAIIEKNDSGFTGQLFATVDGEDTLIDDNAVSYWISKDRGTIYWSFQHYKSGFESEGQGLKRYLHDGGIVETVFEDDVIIDSVDEIISSSGRVALLVSMSDGGLGGPAVAVVDPERGRVFREQFAKVVRSDSGSITVETYDVQAIAELDGRGTPMPMSSQDYDIEELLDREADRDVIHPWPSER